MKNYILKLPQLQVKYFELEPLQEIIMISGGREPEANWFKQIKYARCSSKIYCVDHGVDFCYANNTVPDVLIGDFDSAYAVSVEWAAENGAQIQQHKIDKDLTDTQLALLQLATEEKAFAIMTGVFGGRFDHLYSTIFTCAHSNVNCCLADEKEIIIFVKSRESIEINFNILPKALSLLPMSAKCAGVSIDGVHWSLVNASLNQVLPYALSNRADSSIVHLSVQAGVLALYLYFGD